MSSVEGWKRFFCGERYGFVTFSSRPSRIDYLARRGRAMDDHTAQTGRSGRATIYDVARHAGVAISTVSRVLNDAEDVSPQTRERVLRVVDKLQYRPHRTARSLAQKQMSTLVVAVPTFTMPIFTELLKGIQSDLRQHQIDLLLCDLGSSDMRLRLRRFMDRGAVDGLLLGGLPVDDLPRRPSGRVDRSAAEEWFDRAREETEASPDSWRAWFRLALAYDAAGDRTRARAAARHAIELSGAGAS